LSGAKNYDIVRSIDELRSLWDKLIEEYKPTGFDIETGYLGPDDDRGALKHETNLLVGFSFTNSLNWARYVPMAHDFAENLTDHLSIAEILWNAFKVVPIVAHNLGFELRRMARFFREMLWDHPVFGAEVRESNGYFKAFSDTQVEAYVRRETFQVPHSKEDKLVEYREFALKELVLGTFKHTMIKFEELFDHLTEKKKKAFRFNVLDLTPKVVTYACEDALWCLALHLRNHPVVKDQLVYKVDMELVYVICDMEDCGIVYDWAFMAEASARAKVFTAELNEEIQAELAEMLEMGETKLNVNLGSPKQLSEILFDKLGMKVAVYTQSTKGAAAADKKMSTGKQALDILAEKYPIAKKINQWRNMTKLTGSFLDKYAKDYGNSPDGRIHSSLNQSYVRTARFSSANPNQQNQPSVNYKDDDGKHESKCDSETCKGCRTGLSYKLELKSGSNFKMNFRDSVIAPEDYYILGFDLSQAEYRAVAGHANETAMINAFESGTDIHKFVASMMFKVPINEVTKLHRSRAKTIGFGLLYGMEARALAKRLNCTQEEAQELFDQYFAAFPRIKRWTEKQVEFGYKHGFVMTRFGRKIPVWELYDSRRWIREGGERGCFNYPIQGGATGDYLRMAMVRAHKAIKEMGWQGKVRLFMNVHDALEYYVHRSLNPADVLNVLQKAVIFPVPGWPLLVADWHIGKRWGSVHEIKLLDEGKIKVEDGPEISPGGTLYLPTLGSDDLTWEEVVESSQEEFSKIEEAREKLAVQFSEPFNKTEQDEELNKEPETRHLIVAINHMPTSAQFDRFLQVMEKLEGSNTVELKTPDGSLEMKGQTGIDPENAKHVNVVSLALGGATIKYASAEVDLAAVASDLVF
jgi:DNA polymerase I-like protein with 3'-5' exonuclease and polymerase domains